MSPTSPAIQLPFLSAVAVAGVLYLIGEGIADRTPLLRRYHIPGPVIGGLLGAFGLLLLRIAGTPVAIPSGGRSVDFLVSLLLANLGLHITPKVIRVGLLPLVLFLTAAAVLFFVELAVVYPLAALLGRPVEWAVLVGPIGLLGAPFSLSMPAQIEPIRPLFQPEYPNLMGLTQGLMMLGVLGASVLAGIVGTRRAEGASDDAKGKSARERDVSVDMWTFGAHETQALVLVLVTIAAAFQLQGWIGAQIPGFRDDQVPVIIVAFLLGAVVRLLFSAIKPEAFPKKALMVLLLGPTTGLVLTYALMAIPLYRVGMLTLPMVLGAILAITAAIGVGWLLYRPLSKLLNGYDAAVISGVFVASTIGFGPMGTALLRRFVDEDGPVPTVALILPLAAFYLIPWMVIGLTRVVLS